jgi:putative restriction endonuclease
MQQGLLYRTNSVLEEREIRLELWRYLESMGTLNLSPSILRELRVYGGAQGVWVDKVRTGLLTPDGAGVAVGVLHNGTSYEDDLTDEGILYHYPRTERPSSRDGGEVSALKWAKDLNIPIFVIVKHSTGRRVFLGWVDDFDDAAALFAISFGAHPIGPVPIESDDAPFYLTAPRSERRVSSIARPSQRNFAFNVMRRYGPECAGCGIQVIQVLDAAHIRPKSRNGSDDSRNGLPLCPLHHRALDSHLWLIEPATTRFVPVRADISLQDLRLTHLSLEHLRRLPHKDALQDLWAHTERSKAMN